MYYVCVDDVPRVDIIHKGKSCKMKKDAPTTKWVSYDSIKSARAGHSAAYPTRSTRPCKRCLR